MNSLRYEGKQKGQKGQKRQKIFLLFLSFLPFLLPLLVVKKRSPKGYSELY